MSTLIASHTQEGRRSPHRMVKNGSLSKLAELTQAKVVLPSAQDPTSKPKDYSNSKNAPYL